jgi:competence ComEA-like helix-hairpin-helix protein
MARPSLTFRVSALLLILASPLWTFAAQDKKKLLLRPVNINTANAALLQRVPGIGPKTAERILAMRRNVGQFRSVDDLLAVRGIGPKRLAKMKRYLTVGAVAAAPNHSSAPANASPGKKAGAPSQNKPPS